MLCLTLGDEILLKNRGILQDPLSIIGYTKTENTALFRNHGSHSLFFKLSLYYSVSLLLSDRNDPKTVYKSISFIHFFDRMRTAPINDLITQSIRRDSITRNASRCRTNPV